MDFFTFGIGGIVGFFLGLLLKTWIQPGTTAGGSLLVAICIGVGIIVSALFSAFNKRRSK